MNTFPNFSWGHFGWAFGLAALLKLIGVNVGVWGALGIIAGLSLLTWVSTLSDPVRKWTFNLLIAFAIWHFGPAVYNEIVGQTTYIGPELSRRKLKTELQVGEAIHASGLEALDALKQMADQVEGSEGQKISNEIDWAYNDYLRTGNLATFQAKQTAIQTRIRGYIAWRDDTRKFIATDGFDPNAQDVKNQIDTFLSIPLRYLFWFIGFLILACYILGKSIKRLSWLPGAGVVLAVVILLLIIGDKLIWGSWGAQIARAASSQTSSAAPSGQSNIITIHIRPDKWSDWIHFPPYGKVDWRVMPEQDHWVKLGDGTEHKITKGSTPDFGVRPSVLSFKSVNGIGTVSLLITPP